MSRRYGWPFSSFSSSHVPSVTDDDFSYITPQEIDDSFSIPIQDRHVARAQPSSLQSQDKDFVLIKSRGVTYPATFPPQSIANGQVKVADVQHRFGLMTDLSNQVACRVKFIYKGKTLKDLSAPVCEYGVHNGSEFMAIVPNVSSDSSASEEMVIVRDRPKNETKKKRSRKRQTGKKAAGGDGDSTTSSTLESNTAAEPHMSAPSGAGSNQLNRIDELSHEFTTKWLPLCNQYISSPPTEPKVREDEHRKLSETLMQNVLLKLDEVQTDGIDEVRRRRKDLVRRIQDVLRDLDAAKSTSGRN
ncbi:hypothetical protein CDD82_1562 [Ophiocordyceps australis]|uniref:BAG domain-containing protein n=1 Tax=Ophiocordyceps australis TaxID=1399860 RepID=A0A2C5ZI54_9HYPO|nr:hypothetical protein CDD82_1562 [Ophiocordyceps australis]